MKSCTTFCLVLLALGGWCDSLRGHPVAVGNYDRVVSLRVLPTRIEVQFRLEVNQQTVALDLATLLSREQLRGIQLEEQAYPAFADAYRDILRRNLEVRLDAREIPLRCTQVTHQLVSEPGVEGQQLQCDYRFEGEWTLRPGTLRVTVHEQNFLDRKGRIDLTLLQGAGIRLEGVEQPSAELKARPLIDWQPGDEGRLRSATATLQLDDTATAAPEPAPTSQLPPREPDEGPALGTLLFLTRNGLLVALLIAVFLGALHALTPGHGKTLVAAYLVGERGTLGQAVLLGLITTLAHTWSILLLAVVVQWLWPGSRAEAMQTPLELVGGLIILGLGGWLLFARLLGQADHVHLFGGHAHGPAAPAPEKLSTLRLLLLGIGGGIIPCGDAIAIYLWTLSREPDWAVPVVFAFSVGLAAVLVVLGLLVVQTRRLSDRVWGEKPWMQRLSRVLPIISALLVTVLGLALVVNSMNALRQGSL